MGRQGLTIIENSQEYSTDVLVIGGGITGIGLFRDLALHGVDCHLIEKGDFCSQTSSASSKMLHGGIRYLANLDFSLVKEALEEKNLWLKLAPHLCYEEKFYLPTYKNSAYPLFMSKIGVKLYDMLSHFKNTPSGWVNVKELLNEVPLLNSHELKGAAYYYDAVMDDAKLGLECLYDAMVEDNAKCSSYTEVISIDESSRGYTVHLRDQLSGKQSTISANEIVSCLGPFTDKFIKGIDLTEWKPRSVANKGIHLWLNEGAIPLEHPIVLQNKDGRVIFVIPQKSAVLVGTTENVTDEEIFNIKASKKEINYLIQILEEYFHVSINEADIISSFAGVRPLVIDEHSQISEISRHHKEFQIADNFHIIMGGKYTTFRSMVQSTAKKVVLSRKGSYDSSLTMSELRQQSRVFPFYAKPVTADDIEYIMKNEYIRTDDDILKRRISLPLIKELPKKKGLK